jgi:hypothetical protein
MGYLEALNPSNWELQTAIVTRAMLGTVLRTGAELALPARRVWFVGGSDVGFLLRLDLAHKS